jgi:DNA-binding transcriptional MerR regulator
MSASAYRVKDVARLAKVTVRTLHHYDEIGLLVPSSRNESGYRLYAEDDLQRLQQILLWRELGFPLEEIRRILDDPGFDRRKALLAQRKELVARGRRTARYKDQDWKRMKEELNAILEKLAERMHEEAKASDSDVVELAEEHRLHIDRWFYPCSRKMHEGLASMYVGDDRFKASFERHGEGLAQFLADAIRANGAR